MPDALRRRLPRPPPVTACLAALALSAAAAGCGGGGGPAYSIDLDPAALDFEAIQGDDTPPPRAVTVGFKGDGLLIGYPPGETAPGWMVWSVPEQGRNPTTVEVWVASPAAPASHAMVLRFVTGKADETEFVVRDLPVRYTVRRGLRATQASVALAAPEGTAPPAHTLTLTSDVPADTWSVAVEGDDTGWLALPATSGAFQGGTAQVQVGATGLAGGTYTATLAFRDAAGVVRTRVPVSFEVTGHFFVEGNLAVAVDQGASPAALAVPLTLRTRLDATAGAAVHWAIASGAPWVTVTPAEGDLSADVPLVAHLDPDALWGLANGTHFADLTVEITAGAALTQTVQLALALDLRPALTAPGSAAFSLVGSPSAADLRRTVAVTSNLGTAFAARAGWHAASSDAWVTVGPAAGAGNGSVVLDLQPGAMAALPNGAYQAVVSIHPDDGRVAGASVLAALDLRLPEVSGVTPHAGFVGQAGEVLLRGAGFGARPTVPVSVGGQVVTGRVIDDTRVRLSAPAQASPGALSFSIANSLGLPRAAAEQAILPAPGYRSLYAELPPLAFFHHLVPDPERQAVLLAGDGAFGVRRYRFQGGTWSEDGAALAGVNALAVSADGREIIATASAVYDPLVVRRLDAGTLEVLETAAPGRGWGPIDVVAPFDDGRTLLVSNDQWSTAVWYPELTGGQFLDAYAPLGLLTGDGDRLLLQGDFNDGILSLDAGETLFTDHPAPDHAVEPRRWSVSPDGERLLVGEAVYDRAFNRLGTLAFPAGTGAVAVAMAPDRRTAYALTRNDTRTGWLLGTADVSAAAGPYPIVLTGLPNAIPNDQEPRAMTLSADGQVLYVLTTGLQVFSAFLYGMPLR